MRFRCGNLPQTEGFRPEEDPGWTSLDEPEFSAAMLGAMVLVVPLAVALFSVFPAAPMDPDTPWTDHVEEGFLVGTVGLVGSLVVHELLHALFHPGAGTRDESVLGVWVEAMSLYAFWPQPCS